jgi:hypothetical protein
MALFRKSPETELAERQTIRAKLADQLTSAQARVIDKTARLARLRADEKADPSAILKLQTSVIADERDLIDLANAIELVDGEIADRADQIATAADRMVRQQTASDLETATKRIDSAVGVIVDGLNAFIAATDGPICDTIPDARGLNILSKQLSQEIPRAAAFIATTIKQHREAVLTGHARPTLTTSAPPPAPTPAKKAVPTVSVFAMGPIQWLGGAAHQHQYVALPAYLAQRALELNHVIPIDDPRVKPLYMAAGQRPAPQLPVPDRFVNLEADDLAPRRGLSAADQLIQRHIRPLVRTA